MNQLRIIVALAILLFVAGVARGQVQFSKKPEAPLLGAFYVAVDDHAAIFVNGTKVFQAAIGKSRSKNCELKAGDHVVIHLRNDIGPRGFLMVFASEDGQKIVSFRRTDLKIVSDPETTSFTTDQFQKWTKFANKKQGGDKAFDSDIKNYSDRVWGELDRCVLAAIVTPQMISQRPK